MTYRMPSGHADYLARRDAHYLFTVKRNQPGLHAQLPALPWRQIPVASKTREHGHGRAAHPEGHRRGRWVGLPARAQAIQIVRRRRGEGEELVGRDLLRHHVADRHPSQPRRLAAIIRGHWAIEDRLHWVRDMAVNEDRSQVRTASGP